MKKYQQFFLVVIYIFSDISGYQVGETVTGSTSNATGVISRRTTNNRLVIIKRSS